MVAIPWRIPEKLPQDRSRRVKRVRRVRGHSRVSPSVDGCARRPQPQTCLRTGGNPCSSPKAPAVLDSFRTRLRTATRRDLPAWTPDVAAGEVLAKDHGGPDPRQHIQPNVRARDAIPAQASPPPRRAHRDSPAHNRQTAPTCASEYPSAPPIRAASPPTPDRRSGSF